MKINHWFKSGTPWIWLNAGAVSISLFLVLSVLLLITVNGLAYFWPKNVIDIEYIGRNGELKQLTGEIYEQEQVSAARLQNAGISNINANVKYYTRYLLKVGNRDISGADFVWVLKDKITRQETPPQLMVVERQEWGNFYGYLQAVKENQNIIAQGDAAWPEFKQRMQRVQDLFDEILSIQTGKIGKINYKIEKLRLKQRALEFNQELTPERLKFIQRERDELNIFYNNLESQLATLYLAIERDKYTVKIADGQIIELPFSKVVTAFRPNEMGLFSKLLFYVNKIWRFLSEDPREANTEGGIFPTLFGTVLMVMLMSVIVTPLGVVAAVYLREYAHQGIFTRIIRIAVNNLAGVPSIVYGLFGLGFFVYLLGGSIDQLFYPEALPAPTFGTGGIMWASLTLAILTLPVVIVTTEEGLNRIPRSIREGSLALGATKAETLWRTVIPMASPAIMTGLILAVARAAGEVAPLMLVGVVKLAPSLPLDGNFPFFHFDRKFMHLGFHIYDVGFQSPNVEAARPLVYATAFLLVLVIVSLNIGAIYIRNNLRDKYRSL